MIQEQLEARLRALEARFFGADYVREKDAENEAEVEEKAIKVEPKKEVK